jgi:DNA-binding winged helix-turn-helix (wHTH) protein
VCSGDYLGSAALARDQFVRVFELIDTLEWARTRREWARTRSFESMVDPAASPHRVRVGEFHVDLDSGEIISNGTRVRLQGQSLELLKALLERPGTMIGRDELRQRLWPNDTFVDFDHGLNAAVRRLRETLGDSADAPRFVETIPRKGYRLVAATDAAPPASAVAEPALLETSVATQPHARSRAVRWAYVAIVGGIAAIAAAGVWSVRPATPSRGRPPFASFTVDVPAGWNIQPLDHVALSPDSRYLAFTATGPDHHGSLWLRALTRSEARQAPGSEAAVAPFWSPDSARVGFFASGNLKAMTMADGRVQVLTGVAPTLIAGGAAAWTVGGDILFMPLSSGLGTAVGAAGLRRLDSATGAVLPVAASLTERRDYVDYVAPNAIPDTNAFTFLRWNPSTLEMTGHIGEVGTTRISDLGRIDSRIVVTSSGHAVFVRNGTLVAQPFDIAARRFAGAPIPIAQDAAVYQPMMGHFSATPDVIVYVSRDSMTSGVHMTLVDRQGNSRHEIGEVADYSTPRVSADGTRLAVARRDTISGTRDIWVYDLNGKRPIRLTFDRHDDMSPMWSADGHTILFTSDRSGERDLYRKDSEGIRPEVLVFSSSDSKSLNAWSPDGKFAIYDTGARGAIDSQGHINKDLMTVFLDGIRQVRPLAATAAAESTADISPDGKLVAYQSSESGRPEVFVETFPEKGSRMQVTTTGGVEPVWRADGRELFFLSSRDDLCAVDVIRSGGGVRFGPARVLFRLQNLPSTFRRYTPLPDGQSFVVLTAATHETTQRMTVLVNWRSAFPE